MKALAICFAIALAIVATVAVAPPSGWIFKNQLDLAQKQKPPQESEFTFFGGAISPDWMTDPDTYRGSDFTEEVARALLLPNGDLTRKELARVAQSHPTEPLAWVLVARYYCMYGPRVPNEDYRGAVDTPAQKDNYLKAFRTVREASLRGEALEPNNAYFTLLRAAVDGSLDLIPEMRQAIKEAASKSKYDSHINELELDLQKAQVLEKGYRGEFIKNFVGIDVALPEFTHFGAMGRFLNQDGDLEEKKDMVQASWLMAKDGDLGIEILNAARLMRYAVRPAQEIRNGSKHSPTDSEWTQLAKSFDSKLLAAHVALPQPNTLEIYQKQKKAIDTFTKYSDADWNAPQEKAFWETARPFGALLALAFSIFMAGLAWGFQRIKSDPFRRMLPHLVAVPLWLLFLELAGPKVELFAQPNDAVFLQAGCLFGLLQVSVSSLYLRRRWAVIGSLAVALASIAIVHRALTNDLLSSDSSAVAAQITLIASLGIAVLAWFVSVDKRQQLAPYLGGVVAILGIIFSSLPIPLADASALFGTVGFAITLLLTWKTKSGTTAKLAQWITVALFIIFSGGAGAFMAWMKLTNTAFHGVHYAAGLLALFIAMHFVGKPARNLVFACCVSWILYSGIYLVLVGIQIRSQTTVAGPLHEADTVRKLAGI